MRLILTIVLFLNFQILIAQPTIEYYRGEVTENKSLGIAVNVKIKMFLDQRYNHETGQMRNYMWSKFPLKPNVLFGSQNISHKFYPYNDEYELDSNLRNEDMISWVMVEFRNADIPEISFQNPMILKSDGNLVTAGLEDYGSINLRPGRYYVICTDVQSLGIACNEKFTVLGPHEWVSIDFTKTSRNMFWYGGKKIPNGIPYPAHPYVNISNSFDTTWAAWMGDCPSPFITSSWDNLIDLADWAEVQNHHSSNYLPIHDIYNDESGAVNIDDELFVISMFEKLSGNPFPYYRQDN